MASEDHPRESIGAGYAQRRDEALSDARGGLEAASEYTDLGLFHAAAREAQRAQKALMRAWNEQATGELAREVRRG